MNRENENSTYCIGKRHVVTILGFLLCALLNANRLVLGVAIVAMVKHHHTNETVLRNTSELSCPLLLTSANTSFKQEGEMDWNSKQQGYVLGISFLGFILTQVIAGKIADAIGAKSPLIVSNIVMGTCTLISPFTAWWNFYALLSVQFIRGLSQGFVTPALYRLMSDWYPKNERGFLSTLVVCGYAFGVVISGIVTGWLCDVPHLGWPSGFYFWGTFTLGIAILLQFILHESPQTHPSITEAELKYITEGQDSKMLEKRPQTPWKKIFTSVPCYAYFYGLFGHYWAISYFLSVHPTFMGTILHFPMTENGAVSCLPVLMSSIGGFVASFMCKWLTKKNYLQIDKTRKAFTFAGAFGFSMCMLGIILAGCDTVINILCFTLSLFITGMALSGVVITSMDMSPMFAGSLTGVATTIASTSTFIIPVITGYLTTHETLVEWHSVFWISLAVVGSSGFIFIIFGSAEVQPWNFPEGETVTNHTTEEEKTRMTPLLVYKKRENIE